MSNVTDRTEIFHCECFSPEHMLIVSTYGGEHDTASMFIVQVTADNHLPWYKRIGLAVKYIFGQPSLQWHDILLSPKDVSRLAELCQTYNGTERK